MLKSLFATCLTALSVNTQPLAVPPSLEPSRAISEDTTFNVGDVYLFSYEFDLSLSRDIRLFLNDDIGLNTLRLISYDIPLSNSPVFYGNLPLEFDFGAVYLGYSYTAPVINYSILELDDTTDYSYLLNVSFSSNVPFNVTFTFEILEGFEGFSIEALPYLTKVEQPYTPPAKSNLYRLLYDFYYSIFNDDDLTAITTGYNMPFDNWLAHTCTIATIITLIVVAFFFLRWLFRVISGLLLLKR